MIYDVHDCLEFGVIVKGEIIRSYRDGDLNLGPGNVYYCGRWEPHTGEIIQAPCSLIVAVFEPDFISSRRFPEAPEVDLSVPFSHVSQTRPQCTGKHREQMLEWAERVQRCIPADTPRKTAYIGILLIEGLLLAYGDWTPPKDRAEPSRDRISPALEMIHSRKHSVNVMEAAQACGLSRSRFDLLFKELMGLTFSQYEMRRRLAGVAEALLKTEAPLKAIAQDWGFTDASHLHRRFIEYFGKTPNDYRRS